MTITGI